MNEVVTSGVRGGIRGDLLGVAAAAALVYGAIRGIPAALGKVKLGRGDDIGLVGIALGVLTWRFPRQ